MTAEYRTTIEAILREMPISWLHRPVYAMDASLDVGLPQPKVAPFVVAVGIAAAGAAVGGGLQLASQALNKKSGPPDRSLVDTIECELSFNQIVDKAVQLIEEDQLAKGSRLQDIIDVPPEGAKLAPAVAVGFFIAGVAAGASAARPDNPPEKKD